jgi:hypothetical protein
MEITVYIYKWLNYVELNAWASIRIVNRKLSFSISLPTTSSTQDAGKFCTLTTLSHQGCQHSCQPATVCAQSFFARLCFFLPHLSTCRQDAILLQVVTCPLQAHAFSLSN